MEIIITVISILVITTLVWLFNKALPRKVCPICAGVSLTWLWMLIGVLTNQLPITNYQLPIAILMGGSVVGVSYQLEKRPAMAHASAGKLFLWKTVFIPLGFAAVWSLLSFSWFIFGALLLIMIFTATAFFGAKRLTESQKPAHDEQVKKIQEQMKRCC